jgi:hypothetical protein
MTDPDDDGCPTTDDELALAELAEEVSRRLESGDPIDGADLGENLTRAGDIRQLLPALRTMVSLGEQAAREERSRTRLQKKKRRPSSSFLDTNPEAEKVGL